MGNTRTFSGPRGIDPRTNPAARIVRTAFALRYAIQEAFRKRGLQATTAEWGLLNMLVHVGGQRVGDIAAISRHDRTTITRVVNGLVRKELVDRSRDPEDRRAVHVEINRKGRALHRKLLEVVGGILDDAFTGVTAPQRKAVFEILSHIHDNLVAMED